LGRKEDEGLISFKISRTFFCKAFIIELLLRCFINSRHCRNNKRKGKKIEGKESKNLIENYVTF
jgi:hypothetical protein